MQIESLSEEEERLLGVWHEALSRLWRSTTPLDRPRAEAALSALYRHVGAVPPKFVWVASPMAALFALGLFRCSAGSSRAVSPEWFADPIEFVDRGAWAAFENRVNERLAPTLRQKLDQMLCAPLGPHGSRFALETEIVADLDQERCFEIWEVLSSSLRSQFSEGPARVTPCGRDVCEQVRRDILVELDEERREQRGEYFAEPPASHDLFRWRCWQSDVHAIVERAFLFRASGVDPSLDCSRRLDLLLAGVYACGAWWWPRKNVCIIAERPRAVHCDDAGRLHHHVSKALEFRDGFGIHFWRGERVDGRWLKSPEQIDPAWVFNPWAFDKTRALSAEDRRIAAEIIGWQRVLELQPTSMVDKDEDPSIGELLEVKLPQDPNWGLDGLGWFVTDPGPPPEPRYARFLKVRCATGRDFVLCVPTTMRTAREANAWTFGLGPDDFQLEVRT